MKVLEYTKKREIWESQRREAENQDTHYPGSKAFLCKFKMFSTNKRRAFTLYIPSEL